MLAVPLQVSSNNIEFKFSLKVTNEGQNNGSGTVHQVA